MVSPNARRDYVRAGCHDFTLQASGVIYLFRQECSWTCGVEKKTELMPSRMRIRSLGCISPTPRVAVAMAHGPRLTSLATDLGPYRRDLRYRKDWYHEVGLAISRTSRNTIRPMKPRTPTSVRVCGSPHRILPFPTSPRSGGLQPEVEADLDDEWRTEKPVTVVRTRRPKLRTETHEDQDQAWVSSVCLQCSSKSRAL